MNRKELARRISEARYEAVVASNMTRSIAADDLNRAELAGLPQDVYDNVREADHLLRAAQRALAAAAAIARGRRMSESPCARGED